MSDPTTDEMIRWLDILIDYEFGIVTLDDEGIGTDEFAAIAARLRSLQADLQAVVFEGDAAIERRDAYIAELRAEVDRLREANAAQTAVSRALQAEYTAERALADQLAEALRESWAMPYNTVFGVAERANAALAAHEAARG